MNHITVDFTQKTGLIKPMNAVNNGPVGSRGRDSFGIFRELEIPFARNHDASFCSSYGGAHTVDVHRIFADFDADENDAANYDFVLTDRYIANTESVGTRTFYRLGASIEHEIKKYGTVPPKDYAKWARICEHIIRHYTEGWADGFTYDIQYWEIWNEPDNHRPGELGPCWQASDEEFVKFFCTVAKYLLKCFPDKKIGGPAFVSVVSPLTDMLFAELKKQNIELDFYSYHVYGNNVTDMAAGCFDRFAAKLEKHGLKRTEIILNEWNYIKGWVADDFTYSIKTIIGPKGAAFVLAMMLSLQRTGCDMAMYYDARPTVYNGLFSTYTYEKLPTFYSFYMFKELKNLKNEVFSCTDSDKLFVCGATNDTVSGIALTYFDNDDTAEKRTVALDLTGVAGKAEIYLCNKNAQMQLVRTEYVSENSTVYMDLENFDTVYIRIA